MADIENKEELQEQEKEVNVDNLIALCQKVDPISALRDYAIKESVDFTYEWMIHGYMRSDTKESRLFGTYICLIGADPQYYGNYIDHMINDHGIEEEFINKVLMYIRTGIVPYNIWIDKLISDIKNGAESYEKSSIPSMLLVYLLKTMRTSLIGFNKLVKALRDEDNNIDEKLLKVVDIAEACLKDIPTNLKEEYMVAFSSSIEETRRKFQDNELSLFSEILLDMLQCPLDIEAVQALEKGELPAFAPVWVEPPFGIGTNIAYNARSKEAENPNDVDENGQPKQQNKKLGMGSFAVDVLGYGKDGATPAEMEERRKALAEENGDISVLKEEPLHEISNENVRYVLRKVAKNGSKRVVSENVFNTEEEAEKLREEIITSMPDITRSFDLRIDREVIQ